MPAQNMAAAKVDGTDFQLFWQNSSVHPLGLEHRQLVSRERVWGLLWGTRVLTREAAF